MGHTMTPTNIFMALVLMAAIALVVLALVLRLLPAVVPDFDASTLWGKIGNYLKKAVSGIFSIDTRFLLSEGVDLLKHNFLIPIVAYLAMLPMAVYGYFWMHRSFSSYTAQVDFNSKFDFSETTPFDVAILILRRASDILGYSLKNLDYVLSAFNNPTVILATAIISIFLARSLSNIDMEKYSISPGLKKFFIALVIGFCIIMVADLAIMVPVIYFKQDKNEFFDKVLFWMNYFPGQLLSCISDSFLKCIFYIFLVSQVIGTNLDKKSFWQKVIDSFLPVFYVSLIFGGLDYLLTAGAQTYTWARSAQPYPLVSGTSSSFHIKHIFSTLLDYFFLPFPVVVIMHKLRFKDAVLKLKSWHLKYPERIGGFLLSSWIILFCVSAAMETLNYLIKLGGVDFWMEVAHREISKISFILVSSWLLLCLIQLVRELHETDTGAGDERDYFVESAQEP